MDSWVLYSYDPVRKTLISKARFLGVQRPEYGFSTETPRPSKSWLPVWDPNCADGIRPRRSGWWMTST